MCLNASGSKPGERKRKVDTGGENVDKDNVSVLEKKETQSSVEALTCEVPSMVIEEGRQ